MNCAPACPLHWPAHRAKGLGASFRRVSQSKGQHAVQSWISELSITNTSHERRDSAGAITRICETSIRGTLRSIVQPRQKSSVTTAQSSLSTSVTMPTRGLHMNRDNKQRKDTEKSTFRQRDQLRMHLRIDGCTRRRTLKGEVGEERGEKLERSRKWKEGSRKDKKRHGGETAGKHLHRDFRNFVSPN